MKGNNKSCWLTLPLALLLSLPSTAQSDLGGKVDSLYQVSKVWYGKQAYTQAEEAAEEAIAIEQKRYATPTDTLRRLYGNLGIYCRASGNWSRGVGAVRSAYAIGNQLGIDTLDQRMISYRIHESAFLIDLLRFEKAIYLMNNLKQIIPLSYGYRNEQDKDRTLLGNLNNLGATYISTGQYERAESFFLDLLKRWSDLENAYGTGLCHYNLGDIHRFAGRYEQARFHYERAAENWAGGISGQGIYIDLINRIARMYERMSHRDPLQVEKAVSHADSMATLVEKTDIVRQERARLLNNLGLLYEGLNDPAAALEAYQEARTLIYADSTTSPVSRHMIHLRLGRTYWELGDKERAATFLKQSLADLPAGSALNIRRYTLWSYGSLADFYLEQGDYRTALNYIDTAFARYRLDLELEKPGSRILAYPRTLAGLTALRAISHYELSKQAIVGEVKADHLVRAVDLFAQLDHYLEWIFANRLFEEQTEDIGTVSKRWYAKAIAACAANFEHTQDRQWLDRAFYYSEKSKQLSVWRQWQERVAYGTEIPWRRRENSLLKQLETIDLELNDKVVSTTIRSALLETKAQLEERLYTLRDSLRRAEPTTWRVAAADSLYDLQRTQQLLEPGERLLSYTVVEEENWLFVVSSTEQRLVRLPDSVSIYADSFYQSIVAAFDPYTGDPDLNKLAKATRAYWETGPWLYEQLISLAEARPGDHLILVGDGALEKLPFSALPTGKAPQMDRFDRYPYLSDRYRISHAYSASILARMRLLSGTRVKTGLLAVAPFYFGGQSAPLYKPGEGEERLAFPQLSRGREEIDFLLAQQPNGKALYYPEATKTELLKQLPHYAELYLSTHALAREGEVFAALTREESYGRKDFLYGREVLLHYFPLNLVMLNSCISGIGWLDPGEGMISLGRNFAYAGARSVLATRWPVRQKESGIITGEFYRNCQLGVNKAEALRKAQQKLRAQDNPLFSHPYYWAGHAIYGSTHP